MLESVVSILTIAGFGFGIWKFIKLRLKSSKLKRFCQLVQDWFDFIDKSNIDEINDFELNNIENKISSYIKDHEIENYYMRFDEKFKRNFLKGFFYDKNNIDAEFNRCSRLPAEGIAIGIYWYLLIGEFTSFKSGYRNGNKGINFGDIEYRVKALKMYLGIKQE